MEWRGPFLGRGAQVIADTVERFCHQSYGENVPVTESAVITGRTRLRLLGSITFTGRFRFAHIAGQDYRHCIEVTVFGLPLVTVNRSGITMHKARDIRYARDEAGADAGHCALDGACRIVSPR